MILAAVALPDGNYIIISRRSHVRRKLQIHRASVINFAAALILPALIFSFVRDLREGQSDQSSCC